MQNVIGSSTDEDIVFSHRDIDSNYEPSQSEIKRYGAYLGIDPEEDEEFLYIAEKGLKAPVPEPWQVCQTKNNEIYYFNPITGDSQWEHPCDKEFREEFQKAKAASLKEKGLIIKEEDIQSQINENEKLSFLISNRENKPEISDRSGSQTNLNKKINNPDFSVGSISGLNYSQQSGSPHQSNIIQQIMGSEYGQDSIIKEDIPINEYKEKEGSDKDTISLSEFGFDETKTKRALQEELKSDILIRYEIEMKNELSQYEKELSQKLENVLLECQRKKEYELSLQNNKLQEISIQFQKENLKIEADKIILEKEEAKLNKEVQERIRIETEKEINELKDGYSTQMQQLEQKNNVSLDQQLQNLRIGEISHLEEEKNKIHKEVVKTELEKNELEEAIHNIKDSSNQVSLIDPNTERVTYGNLQMLERDENYERTIRERNQFGMGISPSKTLQQVDQSNELFKQKKNLEEEYFKKLCEEKQRIKQKADQTIRVYEAMQVQKRQSSEERNRIIEFEHRIRNQIREIEETRSIYCKELKGELLEHQNLLRRRREMNKSSFEESMKGELEALANEIQMLSIHSEEKEAFLGPLHDIGKKLEILEREIMNREQANNEVHSGIKKMENLISDRMQQLYGYQAKLQRLQVLLADKSHLLQTVNRTQEQLESVEEECERIIRKRKSVSKRLSTEPVELKQNSVKLNKLLHEIEGIKTAISVKNKSRKNRIQETRFNTEGNKSYNQGKPLYTEDDKGLVEKTGSSFRHSTLETYAGVNRTETENDFSKSILAEIINKGQNGKSIKTEETDLDINKRLNFDHTQDAFAARINTASHSKEEYADFKNHWNEVVNNEKKALGKYTKLINDKMSETKVMQDELIKAQVSYKDNYRQGQRLGDSSSSKKLKKEKELLNERVNQYNCRLVTLNEEKNKLKIKKATLAKIEEKVQSDFQDFSQSAETITELYHFYNQIALRNDLHLLDDKPFLKCTDILKDRECDENSECSPNKTHNLKRDKKMFHSVEKYTNNKDKKYASFLNNSISSAGSKLHTRTEPGWLSSFKHKSREEQNLQKYDKLIRKYSNHC